MPRVASQPRGHYGATPAHHIQSPVKIPLNDDRHEKAIRLQSRQALHDIQINQIKAAASPMRKLSGHVAQGSPQTPNMNKARGKETLDDENMLAVFPNNSMTPMKRVPILANFEEWMKMATDNKINATNSWNFALIDYFHDMSLLKEGDGVNFQKASCTLDGCVKIYTSRVDSVATETGKLLSGLADGANKKQRRGDENEIDDADEGDGEDVEGSRKRAKRKAQRSSEATLASDFAQLQLKKLELEFAVDPLFKKASADFDEGGAKGLLLNHLAIDGQGRIVFDSSDDGTTTENVRPEDNHGTVPMSLTSLPNGESNPSVEDNDCSSQRGNSADVDLADLSSKFFPNIAVLDEQDICPSLKGFDLSDPNATFDLHVPRESADGQNQGTSSDLDSTADPIDLNDNDDDEMGVGGISPGTMGEGFGDGGELWARNAALQPTTRVHDGAFEDEQSAMGSDGSKGYDVGDSSVGISLRYGEATDDHDNILHYFDRQLSKNWAGPEHWRIKRIKDSTKVDLTLPSKRREKEVFEINFESPFDPAMSDLIYTPAASTSAISLPKSQWKSQARNLLPDDKHFNSRQLLRLFLKPRARFGSSRLRRGAAAANGVTSQHAHINEAFWARRSETRTDNALDVPAKADYDANFFQDDCLTFPQGLLDHDEDFADARERLTSEEPRDLQGVPTTEDPTSASDGRDGPGAFGAQLVTQSKRLRPEYVQYARVAKKVDVRRLKEEMWRGIGLDEYGTDDTSTYVRETVGDKAPQTLQFTSIMNGLQEVYPKQAMADISTSYCFICLLHLANEKGLKLDHNQSLQELNISKDGLSLD